MLQLIASLVFTTFLSGCGNRGSSPFTSSNGADLGNDPLASSNGTDIGNDPLASPNLAATWTGNWVSSKISSSGTFSVTVTQFSATVIQPGTALSGSMTMSGSPCFSTSAFTDWIVSGNAVSWSSPEIGKFTGTITGATISGTYSVTSAGACFGDTGVFSLRT